jgi:hypothetical protein
MNGWVLLQHSQRYPEAHAVAHFRLLELPADVLEMFYM